MKLSPISVVLSAVLIICSGCSSALDNSSKGSATDIAGTNKLNVAVAFYPFEFITNQVGQELVNVQNLTPVGTEPHDLELAPQQVALLSSADLVVFQKGFQPAIDAVLEQVTPKRAVDTASFIQMQLALDSGSGTLDPHTWLDPRNMITIAEKVRDALTEANPEAKLVLADNAASLINKLKTLDEKYQQRLASCQIRTFITSHDAFGYLAERYELTQFGIAGFEPDTEPTPARIAEAQQIAKREGVTTIFFETLVSPAVANSIATDLGLKTAVLDPVEGITADSPGNDYLEIMQSNLDALVIANSCS